jgi:hypothetical protein
MYPAGIHPLSYIINKLTKRRLLAGHFQFPAVWIGDPDHTGVSPRIMVTIDYIFKLALVFNPRFAEKIALSGIMDITINTLVICLSTPRCFTIDPILRMIESIAVLPELSRSTAGLTVHGCLDLYDDAVKVFDREDRQFFDEDWYQRITKVRIDLNILAERMASRKRVH